MYIFARYLCNKITGVRPLYKRNLGPLREKALGQSGPDARATPGDEHRGIRKVMEGGEGSHL